MNISPFNSSYEKIARLSILKIAIIEFNLLKTKYLKAAVQQSMNKEGEGMHLLIKNGLVVTMNKAQELIKTNILIKGDRILALSDDFKGIPVDQSINAEGMLVIPGLIQSHIHLCQALFRGLADDLELLDWLKRRIWPLEAAHDQETLYYSALLGCAELIRGGTTGIIDMGTVQHTDSLFQAVKKAGLRYLGGKCLMDQGDDLPPGLSENTDKAIKESLDLINRWDQAEKGRLRYALCPRFAVSCSPGLLDQVRDLSKTLNLPVHTHASENLGEVELVRRLTGLPNITYFNDKGLCNERLIVAHCIHLSDEEINLLVESGSHIVHCPSANLKLASGFAPIPRFLERGANVSLGADGAPCNNNLSAFVEMRLASLIHKPAYGPRAMPASQVFEMATLGGARAMGLENETGSLEPGKKADLALVKLEAWHHYPLNAASAYGHLVYQASASDVYATIVDGKILMMGNRFLTLDANKLRRGIDRSLQTVRQRTGI
ncbi:MAG: 5'-deoxyadenosine deaminase [Syntrophomonas sp.]